jgi:hypothetical protein
MRLTLYEEIDVMAGGFYKQKNSPSLKKCFPQTLVKKNTFIKKQISFSTVWKGS